MKPWSQYWLIAAWACPGFCSMKWLGVFLLPLDGMLVHCRSLPRNLLDFPRQQFAGTCESWLSCPRTQHNVPGQGSNPDRSIRRRAYQPWGHRASQPGLVLSIIVTMDTSGIGLFIWQDNLLKLSSSFSKVKVCVLIAVGTLGKLQSNCSGVSEGKKWLTVV